MEASQQRYGDYPSLKKVDVDILWLNLYDNILGKSVGIIC